MNLFSLLGFAVVAAALAVLLKQYKPEYALGVSLASGALIFALVILNMSPVFDSLKELAGRVADNRYVSVIIKSLGICYVTSLASDTCKDAGQTAIASKVELAGKVTILVLALPLFNNLVSIVLELITV